MIQKLLKAGLLILALFAFLVIGFVIFRKSLILDKAIVKNHYRLPSSHFLQWRGAEVHYTDQGRGVPILMIHGLGGSIWDFRYLDSSFSKQYRVIRVDMPGFGLSDYPATQESPVTLYNEYFGWLLDTLHIDSMYVMGNSMGGMMAWSIAVNYPQKVKKLILFNSAGYDIPATLKSTNAYMLRYDILKKYLEKGVPEYITKNGMKRTFYNYKKFMKEDNIQRFNDMWNREGNLEHIIRIANNDDFPSTESIKGVTCPTLIIWGKQDKIIPVKNAYDFKRDIRNSTCIIYDSCGHVPMLEEHEKVIRDITPFLYSPKPSVVR